MTTVTASDGVPLAVFSEGSASEGSAERTALLVHGYPDTHRVWDDVASALVEAGFRVVRYDVRGAGSSGAPASRDGYRLDQLADDLFTVIDAIGGGPVHLVGHDWGSIQSWHAVTDPRAPGRIATFTSISGPSLDHAASWFRRRLTPGGIGLAARQAGKSWYIGVFRLPGVAELMVRRVFPTRSADAVRGLELYRANFGSRRPLRFGTSIPVQVIALLRDRYVSPSLATDDVHRWVPTLALRTLNTSHWGALHAEAPETARLITNFAAAAPPTAAQALSMSHRPGSMPVDVTSTALGPVVVTGGGSGIGRATALAFAERGAAVVVCDIDIEGARRTAELAGLLGPEAHAYQVDVSDDKAMEAFAADVLENHGVPRIVVNNAGIGHAGTFLSTTEEEWRRVLDVNLWGVIHGCRSFASRMDSGHIVNVASAAAYLPSKDLAAYSASKAAVLALSQSLRGELAGRGIRVSVICPGFVNTNIVRTFTYSGLSLEQQEAKRARAVRLYAMRNYPPEKVARAIVTAVERDKPMVAVTPESKVFLAISRFAPPLGRLIIRRDLA